jgi:phospholipid transport system substrate-binding protein
MRWRAMHTLAVIIVMVFSSSAFSAEAAAQADVKRSQDARLLVESFHNSLLAMMKTDGYEARAQLIQPVVSTLFDVQRIAQVSLGRTWRTLDENSQGEFTKLLERVIVATYADRFDGFTGQKFETDEVKQSRKGQVVRTHLHGKDQSVRLDYFLRNGKVFNIAADGVSDLSLRRADYANIIKSQGYEALRLELLTKVEEAQTP